MPEKLTIQDIARLAGVSKATVSRVLNHNHSVNRELSERVMRIVQEHDFVPNVTATGLAGGRTPLVGVLAPPLTWPAVPEIMRGVAEYIEKTAYEIVLYSISIERNHTDVLDRILGMRMVSGLLAILPGELSRHLMNRFQQGLPLVMIDDQEEPANIPWIGIDNSTGAYEATRHLLDLGHRRIAHIRGPQSYYCAMERFQGYCQALLDAGIAPDPSLTLQGTFEIEGGRQCAKRLFARERSSWPSAIFAGNDQMAYGVLEIAEEQGVRIPEEVVVVGFDDNLLSAHMRPPLTTIRQPFFEMGHKAIEILLT
ncbi:MAG: LacI family DNA-binding transcriptional regulator, partial [Ktedonobacteraceae bacterium]|nr:LacI family DNA-binding transcriptional regulator [Ktedonobacteraceae bacterium]